MDKIFRQLFEIIVAGIIIAIFVTVIAIYINALVKHARLDWAGTSERIELIRNQNESTGKT